MRPGQAAVTDLDVDENLHRGAATGIIPWQAAGAKQNSTMTETMMQRLRRETQPQHDNLEANAGIEGQLQSAGTYRRLLETFYGIYLPLERQIMTPDSNVSRWLPDVGTRVRSNLLRRDLEKLGVWPKAELPLAQVSKPASDAQRFGCLYVLEGSTLGGQILYKQVSEKLGYTAQSGASFLYGYGRETGSMWNRFGAAVEAFHKDTTGVEAAMIESARETFKTFQLWMDRSLAEENKNAPVRLL